jgi:hypothetical protein
MKVIPSNIAARAPIEAGVRTCARADTCTLLHTPLRAWLSRASVQTRGGRCESLVQIRAAAGGDARSPWEARKMGAQTWDREPNGPLPEQESICAGVGASAPAHASTWSCADVRTHEPCRSPDIRTIEAGVHARPRTGRAPLTHPAPLSSVRPCGWAMRMHGWADGSSHEGG